jgi:hypothetical protein
MDDSWKRAAFTFNGGVIPNTLVLTGKYAGRGQCSVQLLDEMEAECSKNASEGTTCDRTRFIQAKSTHWLHEHVSKQKSAADSGQLWTINTSYNLDGANVSMLSPHGVYLIKGFLTAQEADGLIKTYHEGSSRIKKGIGCPVLRHDCYDPAFLTYPGNHCEVRHASSKDFKDDEYGVPSVKRKLEILTRVPRKFHEKLQMSKYEPGDFFSAHYDDDGCHDQVSEVPEKCNLEDRRMVTVLTYLTNVTDASGGATYFPDLDIRVKGEKGDAVLFMPVYLDGRLNPYMMHMGEDAYATKYISQQFIGVGGAWNEDNTVEYVEYPTSNDQESSTPGDHQDSASGGASSDGFDAS